MLHDPAPEKRLAIAPRPGTSHRDAPFWDQDSQDSKTQQRQKTLDFPILVPTSSSALPVLIGQQQRRTRRDDKGSKKGNPTESWCDRQKVRLDERSHVCPNSGRQRDGDPADDTIATLCVGFMATRGGGTPCATMKRTKRNSPARPASPQRHQQPMAPAGLMRGRAARYRRESTKRYLRDCSCALLCRRVCPASTSTCNIRWSIQCAICDPACLPDQGGLTAWRLCVPDPDVPQKGAREIRPAFRRPGHRGHHATHGQMDSG